MNGMPVPDLLLNRVLTKINNIDEITGVKFSTTGFSLTPRSLKSNKLKMSPDDPRIQTLGRDYLNTNKLTKQQWEYMCSHIKNTFKTWNITTSKDVDIIKVLENYKPSDKIYKD